MLANGALLDRAVANNFEVLVTTDQNLRHQQTLTERPLAVVVLSTTSWPRIRLAAGVIRVAIETARPGAFTEVAVP
jgi:hypothetical protein